MAPHNIYSFRIELYVPRALPVTKEQLRKNSERRRSAIR